MQPERHVVRPEQSAVQPVRPAVQPERHAVQPVQPAVPWSKAQVVEWLGAKGWHLEKDRRVRRSFVRFSRKRERQDQPRHTYDVVGMGVEMQEAVPDGLVLWVKKQ